MPREHWVETPLQDICSITTGKRDVNEGNPGGRYLFFTCAQLPTKIDFYEFEGEAILIAGNGFFNVKHYIGRFNAYQRTYVLQNIKIESSFLFSYLIHSLDVLTKDQRGTTVKYIRLPNLQNHLVPLPPLPEQNRIVEKLDAILPKIKNAKSRLDKIPRILKRFRQSVLAAACSGKLTEDWITGSVNVIANEEVEGIFEVPSDWNWGTLDSICDKSRGICYGVIKLGKDITDGVPCLRTSNVRPLFLDLNKVKKISNSISDDYQRSILKGGEILVNVRGTLGGVVVVSNELMGWNISREVALVPVINVNPKFYAYCIATSNSQKWLTGVTKGVAYQGINLEDLRLLPVPILSIEEQDKIVRRVEKLFKLADSLEAKYTKAMERIDKIEQSVLAKAFRGDLAPQDPNDEPAEELLKRILAEKTKLEAVKKKSKRFSPQRNHHCGRQVSF